MLADESTGVAGTHQQLSALGKPHELVLISSMWDIPTPFQVRIIGLDRLKKEIQVGGGAEGKGRGVGVGVGVEGELEGGREGGCCGPLYVCMYLQDQYSMLYVEVGLYHGGQLLLPVLRTGEVATSSSHPRWNQWLKFNIRVKNLPKVCVVCCVVYVVCVCVCVRPCVHAVTCSASGCQDAHPCVRPGTQGEEEGFKTQHHLQRSRH